ncbi:MAG: dihydropteroate synthase [Phycisphaerae bacterium]
MARTLDEILNSHRTGQWAVMGVLNVTPDSFSDGGDFLKAGDAVGRAEQMLREGADMIDIGAESTRPGSDPVDADEQIRRLRGVLPAVTQTGAVVSIDTTSAKVARFALDAGACVVNDVSACRHDPDMPVLLAESSCAVVLMHMLGKPKTMQKQPAYDDVVTEVRDFLRERLDVVVEAGVVRERIILDPGIGFGKLLAHNLALLARLGELSALDRPLLVGPSRKRFIGELTGQSEPRLRVPGTLAAVIEARRRGATVFRVHDVAETVEALKVADAIAADGRTADG